MENYIIRIYRRDKHTSRKLTGVVEDVRTEGKRVFRDRDELWEILNPSGGTDDLAAKNEDARKKSNVKRRE